METMKTDNKQEDVIDTVERTHDMMDTGGSFVYERLGCRKERIAELDQVARVAIEEGESPSDTIHLLSKVPMTEGEWANILFSLGMYAGKMQAMEESAGGNLSALASVLEAIEREDGEFPDHPNQTSVTHVVAEA